MSAIRKGIPPTSKEQNTKKLIAPLREKKRN